MPIPWIDERQPRFRRIGRIRLGHKAKSARTGGEYPVADPHFVLTDAPDLVEVLDERPTTIPVEFIFDDLELSFPHYMRRYSKAGLLCLGGETILYRKVPKLDDQGKPVFQTITVDGKEKKIPVYREDVKDGKSLDAQGKIIWDGDNKERARTVPCDGETCVYFTRGECKPTGFLRFIVRGAERQGFYDIVCHQRAVFGILAQLRMTAGLFGHLTGIPFLLHRGEPEDVLVNTPDKGPVNMKIRTQWVEVEPEWFQEHFSQARQLRLTYAQEQAQERRLLTATTIALWDDDLNGDEPPAIAPVKAFAPPVYPDEGQGNSTTISVFTEDAEDEYPEADDPNPTERVEIESPAEDAMHAPEADDPYDPRHVPNDRPPAESRTWPELRDAVLQNISHYKAAKHVVNALCVLFPDRAPKFWDGNGVLLYPWTELYEALVKHAADKA